MPDPSRPRRSALYMPGSRPRALEKARGLAADVLILDLEDAVAPAEKETARATVAEAVRARAFGRREVVVRVNALASPWGAADLAMVVECRPDAVLIPKIDAAAMAEAAGRLQALGAGELPFWAMIETPQGVLDIREIAGAARPPACIVMGTNDLAAELRAADTPDRAALIPALATCLLAARAHGLAILDGVYNAFRDREGLRAACRQGREMGFDGKTLIHPDQLAIANEVFAPSPAQIETAQKHLAAFEAAEAAGQGVAVVDGRIVENLHAAGARRILTQAEAIRALAATSE
jgi:citrate lyase beta subunit